MRDPSGLRLKEGATPLLESQKSKTLSVGFSTFICFLRRPEPLSLSPSVSCSVAEQPERPIKMYLVPLSPQVFSVCIFLQRYDQLAVSPGRRTYFTRGSCSARIAAMLRDCRSVSRWLLSETLASRGKTPSDTS